MKTNRGMFELQVRNSYRSRQAVIQLKYCGALDTAWSWQRQTRGAFYPFHICLSSNFFIRHIRCSQDISPNFRLWPSIALCPWLH